MCWHICSRYRSLAKQVLMRELRASLLSWNPPNKPRTRTQYYHLGSADPGPARSTVDIERSGLRDSRRHASGTEPHKSDLSGPDEKARYTPFSFSGNSARARRRVLRGPEAMY